MKALVYRSPGEFEVIGLPRPRPGPKQVVIRVRACGVCKTDLHIHEGRFLARFPLTPGHEFSGEIEETGPDVCGLALGQRVTADNAVACGECHYCRKNQPLFCESFYSLGCNGPGGFAEYVLVDANKVYPICDALSFDEAAMAEPTACAVHGMDVIKVQPGDDVLLFGAGPTGLILAQLLAHNGGANLVVAAPTAFKLAMARELAGARTVEIARDGVADCFAAIMEFCPKGFNMVIDATGSPAIVERCPDFTCYGGKVVIYGVAPAEARCLLNPYDVFRRELKIIGSFAQTHCFDRALKYLENRIVRVDRLVTHRFPLARYADALDTVRRGRESLKVIVQP